MTRRVIKFGNTPPTGPVFLLDPRRSAAGHRHRRCLRRPPVQRGDEDPSRPRRCRGDRQATDRGAQPADHSGGMKSRRARRKPKWSNLAYLLGIPVTTIGGSLGNWSKPYPTRDPQFVGYFVPGGHFSSPVDVHFNIGSQVGEQRMPNAVTISMRNDPTGLARSWADRHADRRAHQARLADIIAAVKSMASRRAPEADRRCPLRPHPAPTLQVPPGCATRSSRMSTTTRPSPWSAWASSSKTSSTRRPSSSPIASRAASWIP